MNNEELSSSSFSLFRTEFTGVFCYDVYALASDYIS